MVIRCNYSYRSEVLILEESLNSDVVCRIRSPHEKVSEEVHVRTRCSPDLIRLGLVFDDLYLVHIKELSLGSGIIVLVFEVAFIHVGYSQRT
jgi:hypothetical protein